MSPLSLKAGMTAFKARALALTTRATMLVTLYPEQLSWQLKHGAKSVAQGVQACSSQPELQPALIRVLQQSGVSACRVDIALSSHFMRFAIVGNPDAARSHDELALLCHHAFERVHGELVAGWDIRLSSAAIGQAGLASAVDKTLLDKLATTLTAAGYKLGSVQPTLMRAFNRLAPAGPQGIFVLKEPGRLALLAWQHGGWAAVQLQPMAAEFTGNWQQAVQASLARMQLQLGLNEDIPVQIASLDADAAEAILLPSLRMVPRVQQVLA